MNAAPQLRSLWALVALVIGVGVAQQAWVNHVQAQAGERAAALARVGDIRMISSETCVYCAAARQWFTQHRVPFDECFVERDEACAAAYRATAAQGTPTLWVRGQVLLGFDAKAVLAALERPRG